ncbi:MAG: hypothetical protein AMS27_04135, partial [Bacteroides sp. SM23_62_1]
MKSGRSLPHILMFIYFFIAGSQSLTAQKIGIQSITISDLESHLWFLASDELQGRATGEIGHEIAARYLASQAQKIGLKAADNYNDFFQTYIIEENSYDLENSKITIESPGAEPVVMDDDFYLIIPEASEDLNISGDIVFCGYGINSEKFNYNDFSEVDVQDKIILIMNRGPMDDDGITPKFDDYNWNDMQNFNNKFFYIHSLHPKAILMVLDPKSGFKSLEDINPALPKYLSSSKKLKDSENNLTGFFQDATRLFLIHRNVADKLLEDTGMNLETLQKKIDDSLKPHSFPISGKTLNIQLKINSSELTVPNVFGIIEGSDPVKKDEYLLYI